MPLIKAITTAFLSLALVCPALALESDRQKPLEVNADSTDGMLGDGIMKLTGHVEIRQGTLLIRADSAEVDKADGKVRQIILRGSTASLQQEIEELGLVKAWARTIDYSVSSGMVFLAGDAEVHHPQYEVSGDQLRYDLNLQHFEGNADENGNGRVHIRLDPEIAPKPDVPGIDPEIEDLDPPQGDTGTPFSKPANAAR